LNGINIKRIAMVLAAAALYCWSPLVATSAAQAGGAHKPRPATFGDCKHDNAGVHNGYDCEPATEEETEVEEEEGGGLPS
jgi:hypothetical protein